MRNLNLTEKGTEKHPVRVAENHNSRIKEALRSKCRKRLQMLRIFIKMESGL